MYGACINVNVNQLKGWRGSNELHLNVGSLKMEYCLISRVKLVIQVSQGTMNRVFMLPFCLFFSFHCVVPSLLIPRSVLRVCLHFVTRCPNTPVLT